MDDEILTLMSSKELTLFVGKKVMARRKFLKLSRRLLAAKSGVSEPTLSRLEKQGTATLHVITKVAIALNSIDTFENLFKSPKARSLEEFLSRQEGS